MPTLEAKIQLDAAPCFATLLDKSVRFVGFKGGRGGGKSEAVAEYIVFLMGTEKVKILCTREIQRSIKESVKSLIERKIEEKGLSHIFEIVETEIRHKTTGSVCLFAGLQNHTSNSIKSYDGVDFCWVEEAQTIKGRSLKILVPTIRKAGSRMVFTWNPENELDAIEMFWANPRDDARCFTVNHLNNKYCPKELKDEAEHCRLYTPEEYEHIWLGGFKGVEKGAYYAKEITEAIRSGRIGHVAHDPMQEVHAVFDLGMSDSTAVWLYQFAGREVHIIDCYESNYTSIIDDMTFLSKKPYKYGTIWLPHDARAQQKAIGKSTEDVVRGLGFRVRIVPKLGISQGIDLVRAMFSRFYFNEETCSVGLKAIKAYHEEYDEDLKTGKGPLHDWSSHMSDSLRYLSVSLKEPVNEAPSLARDAYIRQIETRKQFPVYTGTSA